MKVKLAAPVTEICKEHCLVSLEVDTPSLPGQFISIKPDSSTDPLLRRPFSVYDHGKGRLDCVIRRVGPGTERICQSESDYFDILGPSGQGFTLVEEQNCLLVGGGVGNAPLVYLARALKERGNRVRFIYGTTSKDYIYGEERLKKLTHELLFTTDDGSRGSKGYVTDYLGEQLAREQPDRVYTCGPTPMMAGVVEFCGDLPVEVSMENYFGCGVGLCAGCTVETVNGFSRSCVDGPVYNGKQILWDTL
jgi:dihydroorotate dehydrogenase electron transfer subunit